MLIVSPQPLFRHLKWSENRQFPVFKTSFVLYCRVPDRPAGERQRAFLLLLLLRCRSLVSEDDAQNDDRLFIGRSPRFPPRNVCVCRHDQIILYVCTFLSSPTDLGRSHVPTREKIRSVTSFALLFVRVGSGYYCLCPFRKRRLQRLASINLWT